MELCSLMYHSYFLVSHHKAHLNRKRFHGTTVSLPKVVSLTHHTINEASPQQRNLDRDTPLDRKSRLGQSSWEALLFYSPLEPPIFQNSPCVFISLIPNDTVTPELTNIAGKCFVCFNFPVFYLSPFCCNRTQWFVFSGNKCQPLPFCRFLSTR